jgi:hypothetical protein
VERTVHGVSTLYQLFLDDDDDNDDNDDNDDDDLQTYTDI